jgi:hypothetical protein
MRNLLLLLFASTLLIACNNADNKTADAAKNTDLIQQNLKGKVQRLEESSSTIDSAGSSKPDSSSYINDFDEKGYQTSYVTNDINGKAKEEQAIEHYEGGQVKGFVTKNAQGKQTVKWEIAIDSNGKYSGAKVYDSSNKLTSIWKELAENEYGQVIKGTEYKEDGTLKSSFVNNYDSTHYIGGQSKDSSGKETFHSSITLNDKGDPSEESTTTVTKDTSKTEKFSYKYDSYDDKGNWTQRTSYNEKGKPVKVIKRTISYYKD